MSLDWAITGAFLIIVIGLAVAISAFGLLVAVDLLQTTFYPNREGDVE